MSKIVLAISIFMSALHSLPISSDYEKVVELAKAYQKMYVLAFTGSDWADPVPLLEVSSNALMIVSLDFPELNRQDVATLERNAKLRKHYGVETFPTLILCDEEGDEVARFQNASLGKLKDVEAEYMTIKQKLEKNCAKCMDFEKALGLGATCLANKIMEQGLQQGDPAFLMERFAQLVGHHHGKSPEAEEIYQKLSELDPKNHKGLLRRASLLAYQAQNSEKPLLSFLEKAEGEDDVWKIHLLICEHLFEKQEVGEACKHAELCMDQAPPEEKSHIALILRQLRSN